MSKESQDACHNGCPVCFGLDAFERKAQYKSAVVSFVSDTCALIAGYIRKYWESSIYGNDAIRSRNRITALIGQTRDRDCAPQSFNLIRTLIRQATLIAIFQYFLCKLPVALCAAHIASYISTADKKITSRLTITGHNSLHSRGECLVVRFICGVFFFQRAYFDLMKRIAVAYNNSTAKPVIREEMKKKFLAMYDHITDQGVAYGSCWGNIHHYGYSVRGLYLAYFLMKDVLREAGKLQEAERTLRWYAITNEVYPKPEVDGIDMDSFNTQTTGRIASILMMEDTPEKLQYLRSFSRWIDYGCRPALGLSGSFKVDGGAFHHRNNYPAYAVGGLDGATNMIYLLSRTEFAVSKLAHETVKNVLLTMRFYCNKLNFPLSMSGRHPDGKGKLVPMHFAMMALAGSPDGKAEYDSEMASSYLRLISNSGVENDAPEYMPKVSNAEERKAAKLLIS